MAKSMCDFFIFYRIELLLTSIALILSFYPPFFFCCFFISSYIMHGYILWRSDEAPETRIDSHYILTHHGTLCQSLIRKLREISAC